MSGYDRNDFLGPNLLIKETVAFARLVLGDLKLADPVASQWNPKVFTVGLQCAPIGSAYYRYKDQSTDRLVPRRAYETTHPAIVDAFERMMEKLVGRQGFTLVGKVKDADMPAKGFHVGCSRGMTEIMSISVTVCGDPAKLRQAVASAPADLESLCVQSLQEVFSERTELRKAAEARRPKRPGHNFGFN